MVDQNARDRLEQRQIIQVVTNQIQELIELIRNAPFLDGLSIQLSGIRQSLDHQDIVEPVGRLEQTLKQIKDNQLVIGDLKEPLAEIITNFKILTDSFSQQVIDSFPKDLAINGKVNIGSIDSLPSVQIKNKSLPVTGALDILTLPEIEITNRSFGISGPVEISNLPPVRIDNLADLAELINETLVKLQAATTLAIEANKVDIPSSTKINGAVEIVDFSELLDGIEELKKGFNLLIAKESTGFDPTNPMKVEIVADLPRLVPQPSSSITNIGGSAITLGQKTMDNSLPVVLPSDQEFTFISTSLTSVGSFQTTVITAGTRIQLPTNTCKTITIKAKTTNTGLIYAGTSTTSSSVGFILSSGDAVSLDISNTNLLYIDSSVNGEGVSCIFAN